MRQTYAKVLQTLLGTSIRCVRGHYRFSMDITRCGEYVTTDCWRTLSGCALRLIRGKIWNLISKNGRVTRMANLDDVLIFVHVGQVRPRWWVTPIRGMPPLQSDKDTRFIRAIRPDLLRAARDQHRLPQGKALVPMAVFIK
jgi:hypothetical protein